MKIDNAQKIGYNPYFLLQKISLPVLSNELQKLVAPVKNSNEDILHYHNYSVAQNALRKFPFYSAANIDGSLFKKITRKDIFPKGRDKWLKDKRIAYAHQWGYELYGAPHSDFDKGHMTKREDVQWGSTNESAAEAARTTFYYTNAVSQHKGINQSLWRKLEDYILHDESIDNDLKISVFTGPVLQDTDPLFVSEVRSQEIQLPTLFWKVVYYQINQHLYRVAFLMGQKNLLEKDQIVISSKSISMGDELFTDFELAETYQVNVNLIEKLTGLTFSSAIDVYSDTRPSHLILDVVNPRGSDKSIEQISGLVLI